MALFSKEQTISETSIANKFRLERERDMEMLQNRFPFKVSSTKFFYTTRFTRPDIGTKLSFMSIVLFDDQCNFFKLQFGCWK